MGSTFRHAHVRVADVAAVAEALSKRARANRFVLAAESEASDYDVVVATDPASPEWTSIDDPFGDFVWELSDELATDVVELEIFDSDVFHARLCNEGEAKVDVFCSRPGYTDEPARAVKGQPKRWDRSCVPGKSWRDVQRAFKGAADDPEAALVELGKLLGLHERSLHPDHLDPAVAGVRRLRFRNPPAPRRRIVAGPPVAKLQKPGEIVLSLRSGARACGTVVRSEGGGADGVELALGGPAVTSGLVTIDSADYRHEAGTLTRDGTRVVVTFPKSGFPAASGFVNEGESEPDFVDQKPDVRVGLVLKPLEAGRGELELSIAPLGPSGEASVVRCLVRVDP